VHSPGEQIHVPFVKDRDVTLRATRTLFPETGEYEVTSIAVPEGPSESPDYVRVRTNESHWRLVPNAGGTAVTYTIRTDPGRSRPRLDCEHGSGPRHGQAYRGARARPCYVAARRKGSGGARRC